MAFTLPKVHASTLSLASALSALFVCTCVPEFDDQQSLITTRRILAVRATPAEAQPRQTVELTALVVGHSENDSQANDLRWALCLARKPLTELGPVADACIREFGTAPELFNDLGVGAQVTATVPADVCKLFGPQRPPAGADGIAGRAVDPDLSGGYHQPIVVSANERPSLASVRVSCGAVGVPSTELVKFNQGYRPNENPELERVELVVNQESQTLTNDVPLTVPAGARVELVATWPACPRSSTCGDGLCTAGENQVSCAEDCRENPRGCTGAESYLWANPETRRVQERRESITVAWFSTAGRFSDEQTGRTENDPDGTETRNGWIAPSTSGPVQLWLTIRDDRGGTNFKQFTVNIQN